MKAHFFDIDSLIRMDQRIWIISTDSPNIPLAKLTVSEYNSIKNSVYYLDNKIKINNEEYWVPRELIDELKRKSKKTKVSLDNLFFSMQEFINPEIIKHLKYEVLVDNFIHLKNKSDEIWIFMDKNTKKNYTPILENLQSEMMKLGLKPSGVYYLSDSFFGVDEDLNAYKKLKVILQHFVGLKQEGKKFTDEEIFEYDEIYFYSEDDYSLEMFERINEFLYNFISNSDENLANRINLSIKSKNKNLIINKITFNKVRPFITSYVSLVVNYLNKTFEGFKYNRRGY